MTKIISLIGIAFALAFAYPAAAADNAACQANWAKMDAKKAGYVMSSDAKDYMEMMTKAGRKMAAADRISDKEFMDACMADIFPMTNNK
jgi:hypothetical protein